MIRSTLSGTGVSAIQMVRTRPCLSFVVVCLICLVMSGPSWAFDTQTLDQTHAAAESSDTRSADDRMKKSLSCAIYLNRADNRRAGFSSSGSRVALMADPKPSFGLVVGFRLSLGPDSVNRQHRSSLDVWRPGQRQGARDEALEDYRRCKTGQALRALGQP